MFPKGRPSTFLVTVFLVVAHTENRDPTRLALVLPPVVLVDGRSSTYLGIITRLNVLFLELKPTGNLAAIYAFTVLAGLINDFVRILQNSTIFFCLLLIDIARVKDKTYV